jgi:hypothetical protein
VTGSQQHLIVGYLQRHSCRMFENAGEQGFLMQRLKFNHCAGFPLAALTSGQCWPNITTNQNDCFVSGEAKSKNEGHN